MRFPWRSVGPHASSTSTRPAGSSATCVPSSRCAPEARPPMPSSSEPTPSPSSEPAISPAPPNAAGVLILAAAVGVALGVFSTLADGIIPGRLVTLLGNIAAPWVIGAFVVGYRATTVKQGALVGAVTLVVGVATYYVGGSLRDYAVANATNVIRTVVARGAR